MAARGAADFLRRLLQLQEFLRGGESVTNTLRDFVGLKEAAQKIGGTASGHLSFENQKESARAAFATAKNAPAAVIDLLGPGYLSTVLGVLGGDSQSMAEMVDVTLLPPYDQVAKYFYFNVGTIAVTPEQITFKMFTPTPPSLRR